MRTIEAKYNALVPLGRQGENNAQRVLFDLSEFRELEGAHYMLLNQRPNDLHPYPVSITVQNGRAEWIVSATDVAQVGRGHCELIATLDDVVQKTIIFGTVTAKAMGEAGPAPEPYAGYVEDIARLSGSAANSAENAARSLEELREGIASGEFKGEKGDPFRYKDFTEEQLAELKGEPGYTPIKGIDYDDGKDGKDYEITEADYDAIAERVPIPTPKVDDVTINGTSIVSGGVANVPIATESVLGLVKGRRNYNNYTGIRLDNDGLINIAPASNDFISNRTQPNTPITVLNLDYAVKAALCDGKGAEYTDAEKKAARERIGLGDWELIADITLTEDSKSISIDASGCKQVVFIIANVSVDSNTTVNVGTTVGGFQYIRAPLLRNGSYASIIELNAVADGILTGWTTITSGIYYGGSMYNATGYNRGYTELIEQLGVIYLTSDSDVNTYKVGTHIKAYGVKA